MAVATGYGCKEVYRFPHIYISTYLVSVLFYSSIPLLLFFTAASLLFVHLKKLLYRSCVTVDYVYKIRIASWPAVHVCEGSLQVGFQPFYIFF